MATVVVSRLESFVGDTQHILVSGQNQWYSGSNASLRVIVRNHRNLTPIANANVRVMLSEPKKKGFRKRDVLFRGKTDKNGTVEANFAVPSDMVGHYELSVAAQSRHGKDNMTQPITIKKTTKTLLTTDKPIYQPGQTIHIRTLSLMRPKLTPAANQEIVLQVEDAKGNRIFKKTLHTSDWGIASADCELADEVNLGRYTVKAALGDETVEKKITVKRYVLPKFKVDFKSDRTFYLPNQTMKGTVGAKYFFGKPVLGGDVTVKIATFDVIFNPLAELHGKTDADGVFSFSFDVPGVVVGQPLEQGDAILKLEIAVVDSAHHEESATKLIKVAAEAIRVDILPESGGLVPNLENHVYIITSYPDGAPAKTTITHITPSGDRNYKTNEHGVAEVTIKPEEGRTELEMKVADAENTIILKERLSVYSTGGYFGQRRIGWRGSLLVRTDKAVYKVGDRANLEFYGHQVTGSTYVDFIREGQTILTKACPMSGGRGEMSLELSPDMSGMLTIHAYILTEGNSYVRDAKVIYVEPANQLNISASLDKSTYLPGDEAKINFSVKDEDGKPAVAALGIDIVDESVFAIEEMHPGLERVYFMLEEEILKPQFQIKYSLPESFTFHEILRSTQTMQSSRNERTPANPDHQLSARAFMALLAATARTTRPAHDYRQDSYTAKQARPYSFQNDTYPQKQAHIRDMQSKAPLFIALGLFTILVTVHCVYVWLKGKWLDRIVLIVPPVFIISALILAASNNLRHGEAVFSLMVLSGAVLIIYPIIRRQWAREMFLVILPVSALLFGYLVLVSIVMQPARQELMQIAFVERKIAAKSQPRKPVVKVAPKPVVASVPHMPEVKVREFFPETLYFNPAVITDERGRAELKVPLADSITSWRLRSLASSQGGKIGSDVSNIRVFQDFFIDIDLPVSLTHNDEVSIPIAVYNYLQQEQKVKLKLMSEPWFELLDIPGKEVQLAANAVDSVYYRIKVKRIGEHTLTVYGYGEKLNDAIKRKIRVLPNGEEFAVNINERITGDLTQTVQIPQEAIDGASKILVKIYPGVFSQAVEGLDALLRLPGG